MTKIREPFFADFPQYLPEYWTENRENQSGIYFKAILSIGINLSYDGGFTDLSYDEGGLKVPPPPFLFVKTIEKVIRLCTVLKKKLFDWQF